MNCQILQNNDRTFKAPPVCTIYWDDVSWDNWWICCGSKTVSSGHKEMIKSLSEYWKPILGEGYTLACGCSL